MCCYFWTIRVEECQSGKMKQQPEEAGTKVNIISRATKKKKKNTTFPASTAAGMHSHRAEGSSPQGRTLLVSIHLTSYTGQRRSRSVCWVQDVRSARAPTKTVIISSSFSGLNCCISTEPWTVSADVFQLSPPLRIIAFCYCFQWYRLFDVCVELTKRTYSGQWSVQWRDIGW